MLAQFFTVGMLMLLSAMLPGPDFAIVTKNTVMHNRRAGLFTTLGISAGLIIHLSYCLLGLAYIISKSLVLFSMIKYVGAAYLIFIGIKSFFSKDQKSITVKAVGAEAAMKDSQAFYQGFLCNLLNPKVTLFFLALFTVIIKPNTPTAWNISYALEILTISMAWFCSLVLLLSHPRIVKRLDQGKKYISKLLGATLVSFGVVLACIKNT